MQTLIMHSALWRGMSLFAGMLLGKVTLNTRSGIAPVHADVLVSWCSNGRSRREDELARGTQTGPAQRAQ
jgi:hypothetical protein